MKKLFAQNQFIGVLTRKEGRKEGYHLCYTSNLVVIFVSRFDFQVKL